MAYFDTLKLSLIVLLVFSGCLNSSQDVRAGDPEPLKEIVIADAGVSPESLFIFIALDHGFFEEEGLNVKLNNEYAHGQENIAAIVKGEVHMATASETPLMRAGFLDYDISTFATLVTAENILAIVARKDRGITAPSDLEGKKIGVTIGSNAEFFLDLFSLIADISSGSIKKVHVKPFQMADYLESGEVDAIVSWYPNWKNAEIAIGENAETFYSKGIYTMYYNLIASNDFIAENPDTIKGMLRALIKAEAYAKENPDEIVKTLAKRMHTDDQSAFGLINNYDSTIRLEQSLLITLDAEARWLIKKGLTNKTKPPNYLDYIHLDSLAEIAPESVTIIGAY